MFIATSYEKNKMFITTNRAITNVNAFAFEPGILITFFLLKKSWRKKVLKNALWKWKRHVVAWTPINYDKSQLLFFKRNGSY